MKLLLDANLSWRLVAILQEQFGECVHVDDISELEFPARDSKIWQYAKDNGYAIVTRDNDFFDLIALRGFPPKIIWLRSGNCSLKYTVDLLLRSKQAIQNLFDSKETGLLEIV
jgi:predicted nuclease of predicted toxin-antitoxin system